MKKSTVCMAALLACVGAAQAQSVTLYGLLDASVGVVRNPTASANQVTVVNDSAQSSSVWGMRGTEDLGGGLKAGFNLQSDLRTDTGAGNLYMFRREAHVNLTSAEFGEVRLGRTMSPAIANAQGGVVIPSNSIGVVTAAAVGVSPDFFTKNAVTWYSPRVSGVQAIVQYGFGEQAAGSSRARKVAASLVYQDSNLRVGVAGQNVKDRNGNTARTWYNANAMYTLDAFKFGVGWYRIERGNNALPSVTETAASTPDQVADFDTGMTIRSSHGYNLSVGYQVTPQAIVAATYVYNNQDAALLNIQGRYSLSKRTTAYLMFGRAFNENNNGTGADAVRFSPYFQGATGAAGVHQSVLAAGMIHTF